MSLSESVIILFVLSNIDICYFMQESIEPVVLEEHQIGDPPLPPQCTCIFVDIGIYIFFMQLDSEQVVLEEHSIRVVVSEAPQPTITYSRTVSKNVILVWNLNKCT